MTAETRQKYTNVGRTDKGVKQLWQDSETGQLITSDYTIYLSRTEVSQAIENVTGSQLFRPMMLIGGVCLGLMVLVAIFRVIVPKWRRK